MKRVSIRFSLQHDFTHNAFRGFILIEVMVFSCILILLAALSMSYAAHVYLRTSQMLQASMRCAHMQTALDALVRDIAQAPVRKAAWKLVTPKQHVWAAATDDVGFENTDHGIVRSQGYFDRTKKAWVKRTKSFLPPGFSYVIELLDQDESCIYLLSATILSTDKERVHTSVALRSGVCV